VLDGTVPETSTEQTTRRADELKPGDWITGEYLDEEFPCEILFVHPYTDGDQRVILNYTNPDGIPFARHAMAAQSFDLATPAEIDAAREGVRRFHLVSELRQLAMLIEDYKLPVPEFAVQIHFPDLPQDEAKAFAAVIGAGVETNRRGRTSVVWPKGRLPYEDGVYASWGVLPVDEPADPTGLGFSREADTAEAGPVAAGIAGGPVGRAAKNGGKCKCPVRPFPEGRGDSADTIVEHADDCAQSGGE
jgi:hypothetical protein